MVILNVLICIWLDSSVNTLFVQKTVCESVDERYLSRKQHCITVHTIGAYHSTLAFFRLSVQILTLPQYVGNAFF